MTFQYGTPISGENFKNREEEIENILDLLGRTKKGTIVHIGLLGPRRIGKTSLLGIVAENLRKNGSTPVYTDALDLNSADSFFKRLRRDIEGSIGYWNAIKEKIKDVPDNIRGALGNIEAEFATSTGERVTIRKATREELDDWRTHGNRIFTLIKKYSDFNFVIMLDEIGFVRKLKGDNKRDFLDFLRVELSKPKTPPFIICGSQNIYLILGEEDPDNFSIWDSILHKVQLKNFEKDAFIEKILEENFKEEKIGTDAKTLEKICQFIYKFTNGHPNFAQLIGLELTFRMKRRGTKDIGNLMMAALEKQILSDEQQEIKKLLDIHALGKYHRTLKAILRNISINEIKTKDELKSRVSYSSEDLEEYLDILCKLNYIEPCFPQIELTYPFLRYYFKFKEDRDQTMKELMELWNSK